LSNTDSFVDEVSEELRRDKLFAFFRRYGWIAILLVLLLVGAATIFEWRRIQDRGDARALGDAMMTALENETPEARAVAIEALPAEGEARTLRDFMAAAQYAETDQAKAGELLQGIAGNGALPLFYTDLAALKLTMLPDFPMLSDERLKLLEPLTQPGRPYRISALERSALLHIERNETEAALTILRQLASDGEATQAQRGRASDLIVALGGDETAS
jgi:hypothetical protein